MHIQQFFGIKNKFSKEECLEIINLTKNDAQQKATVLDPESNYRPSIRNTWTSNFYKNKENEWVYKKIWETISFINKETLEFKINRIEPIQYLEYKFGNFYKLHTDNGSDEVSTRKLTLVLQLSDPKDYIGGSLEIYTPAKEVAMKAQGSVAVFPSHLPHVAKPVWYGSRKILVAWATGILPLQ